MARSYTRDTMTTSVVPAALSMVALMLHGCELQSFLAPRTGVSGDAIDRVDVCGPDSPWCADSWSKTYEGTLSSFDAIVAPCPKREYLFYDKDVDLSTAIKGKYEWYCASRQRYHDAVETLTTERKVELTGYNLQPAGAWRSMIDSVPFAFYSFDHVVTFKDDFYEMDGNQCYVDFADAKVGGGVFRNGLAQEETMFLQLPELLLIVQERRGASRPMWLSTPKYKKYSSDVIVFTNVLRPAPAVPKDIAITCGRPSKKHPQKDAWPCAQFALNSTAEPAELRAVIAVNAQDFNAVFRFNDGKYSKREFDFLGKKVFAAFAAAKEAGCQSLNSGPLGAGVFAGSEPLTILLHAVMATAFEMPVTMHGMEKSRAVKAVLAMLDESSTCRDENSNWLGFKVDTIADVIKKLWENVEWFHGQDRDNRYTIRGS